MFVLTQRRRATQRRNCSPLTKCKRKGDFACIVISATAISRAYLKTFCPTAKIREIWRILQLTDYQHSGFFRDFSPCNLPQIGVQSAANCAAKDSVLGCKRWFPRHQYAIFYIQRDGLRGGRRWFPTLQGAISRSLSRFFVHILEIAKCKQIAPFAYTTPAHPCALCVRNIGIENILTRRRRATQRRNNSDSPRKNPLRWLCALCVSA